MQTAPSHDDFSRMLTVMLRHPREAWGEQTRVDAQWRELHFLAAPDFARACEEADGLTETLQREGIEVLSLPSDDRLSLDALYARDAGIVCQQGLILARMGKPNRRFEPAVLEQFALKRGFPIVGRIEAPGLLEGGDVAWLDRNTVAVGLGYRSNAEGARQLRALLGESVQVIEVPLPHWNGPGDVLHLMSFLSPIAERCAVVYSRMMPVPFRQWLLQHEFELIEVPDVEYDSLGCNILAIAPKRVLMLEGNPVTRGALQRAGCTVIEYRGREISWAGSGGPTCLTRPWLRAG